MIYAKKVMILQSVSLAKAIKKLAEKRILRLEKKYTVSVLFFGKVLSGRMVIDGFS